LLLHIQGDWPSNLLARIVATIELEGRRNGKKRKEKKEAGQ
jgi:hypothetical protein